MPSLIDESGDLSAVFVLVPAGTSYRIEDARYCPRLQDFSSSQTLTEVFEQLRLVSTQIHNLDMLLLANSCQQIVVYGEVNSAFKLEKCSVYFPKDMEVWQGELPQEFADSIPRVVKEPRYVYIVTQEDEYYDTDASLVCLTHMDLSGAVTVAEFCENYPDIVLDDDQDTDCQRIATELGCIVVHVTLNEQKVAVRGSTVEYHPEERWSGEWPK